MRATRLARFLCAGVTALAMAVAAGAGASAQARPEADRPGRVDGVFARWNASTPGCSVGVAERGQQVLATAYGMADLEHGVPNTPDTIFEAGSVSKQFTAAAVLVLAREGKLSLDDPARQYVPELPDYGTPLTIRHLLTHTSGLRDWGSLAAISGWARTTRAHTHAHVLDIVSRQRSLNFPPGARYSYSNTGYNLAAIIVSRVSGMPFADFTRTRIFEPLGMSRTSWRDDYTRIVKDRAVAYVRRSDGFHILMPFENVHGNGGLLTTVGDLLKWNENFVGPRAGDRELVLAQQEPGRFKDGRAHGYALGLMVGTYKGVREIGHSGSTAGYSAHLLRYPDQHLSIAVLCNGAAPATAHARAVADIYLEGRTRPEPEPKPIHVLAPSEIDRVAGVYRDALTGVPTVLVRDADGIRVERGPALVALSGTSFVTAARQRWEFDGQGGATVTDEFGTVDRYRRVEPAGSPETRAAGLVGTYASDEIETELRAAMKGKTLVLERRPDEVIELRPVYEDGFDSSLGFVAFKRAGDGRAVSLTVSQPRVWALEFTRRD